MPRTSTARIVMQACVFVILGAFSAEAAPNNGSGPTQAQIYCQNRAVNDYWDNVKACELNLSDIPDQLALCKADALGDLKRAKSTCLASRTIGGFNKAVLAPRSPAMLAQ